MLKSSNSKCTHAKVERRSRSGLMDALMYRLGRYPWNCRLCGCRVYFKDRRPTRSSRGVKERDHSQFAAAAGAQLSSPK